MRSKDALNELSETSTPKYKISSPKWLKKTESVFSRVEEEKKFASIRPYYTFSTFKTIYRYTLKKQYSTWYIRDFRFFVVNPGIFPTRPTSYDELTGPVMELNEAVEFRNALPLESYEKYINMISIISTRARRWTRKLAV
jgi:hypothetical protein